MKNILFITILFISLSSNAQEFITEKNTIIGKFENESKNKSKLFASINNWISSNYDLSKNVQLNDLESGKIIIKGITAVSYNSLASALYPNNKDILPYDSLEYNYVIEINIEDYNYEIVYKIIDLATENVGKDNLFFKCINLNHTNEIAIREYNEQNELFLKEGLVEKNKRKDYSALARPMFREINNNLIFNLKQTMAIIEKFILNPDQIAI